MNQTISPGARTGSVRIPASKSQAHRLLICAALGAQPVTLRCDGISADIAATVRCLRALGADITDDGAGTLRCFIHVVLPVCQPILGAAVALSFADCWNLVEQPLTYLTTRTELYPLSVVFNQLTQQSTGVEFAGAALYTLPALLIYLYFQNDILEGVQLTELK